MAKQNPVDNGQAVTYPRSLIEASLDPLVTISVEGLILDVNLATEKATGVSRDNLIGSKFSSYFTDPDQAEAGYRKAFDDGQVINYPLVLQHLNGKTIEVLYNAVTYKDEAGNVLGVFAAARDITEWNKAQAEILRLNKENELILAFTGDGLYGVDIDENTTFVNPAAERLTGWKAEDLIGRHQHDLLHHTYPDGTPFPSEDCPIYATLRDGQVKHISNEVFWRKDGTSFPVSYVVTPMLDNEHIIGAVISFKDITDQLRVQDEITRLAMTDPLTGIANRNQFNQRVSQHLKLAKREKEQLAMMYLDLDEFKPVNDNYGHRIGDVVLKKVAKIFTRQSRQSDIVARLGGDEFAILLIHPKNKQVVSIIAQRIIEETSKPIVIEEHTIQIGVSIGIALFPDDSEEEQDLIEKADLALYEAKRRGRNTFVNYSPDFTKTI